jgi:hypothetical protein
MIDILATSQGSKQYTDVGMLRLSSRRILKGLLMRILTREFSLSTLIANNERPL